MLDQRRPPSLELGTVALVLSELTLQRGPIGVATLIPEARGSLMVRRRIVMAARGLKVGLGRPFDTRSLPNPGVHTTVVKPRG